MQVQLCQQVFHMLSQCPLHPLWAARRAGSLCYLQPPIPPATPGSDPPPLPFNMCCSSDTRPTLQKLRRWKDCLQTKHITKFTVKRQSSECYLGAKVLTQPWTGMVGYIDGKSHWCTVGEASKGLFRWRSSKISSVGNHDVIALDCTILQSRYFVTDSSIFMFWGVGGRKLIYFFGLISQQNLPKQLVNSSNFRN